MDLVEKKRLKLRLWTEIMAVVGNAGIPAHSHPTAKAYLDLLERQVKSAQAALDKVLPEDKNENP